MNYCVCIIIYIVGHLNYTAGQFSLGVSSIKNTKNSCDTSKTALVEQFFNVIFSEFHSTPPLCTCVQMCPEQPTYCYPNGCLKKTFEIKIDKASESPVSTRAPKINVKAPIFYVDEKNGLMGGFVENPRQDGNLEGQEQVLLKSLRPDPFKDRYKIYFKNKKSPKVELKYHHGEQIKNLKSELRNDVSNSRWPLNKNRRSSQRIYLDHQKVKSTLSDSSNLHTPKVQRDFVSNIPMKYFKRELNNLTNKEFVNEDAVDYISAINKSAPKNIFSLESLLMYIENKLDPIIDSSKELNYDNKETYSKFLNLNVSDTSHNLIASQNESTHIISMNFTLENVDKNIYLDENNIKSQSSWGTVKTATEKVDQNATNLDVVQTITNNIVSPEEKVELNAEITQIAATEKSGEKFILSIGTEHKMTTKSQQRVTRNLYQRKSNLIHNN